MMGDKQTSVHSDNRAALRAGLAIGAFVSFAALLFYDESADLYLWLKALHIIAVISWMAAIFYLPRLFIYHTNSPAGSEQSETFKIMEQRLIRIIMNPAMMISWLLGLYLAWSVYGFSGGWLHAKIALVVSMTIAHIYFTCSARRFANDKNTHSTRHWRLMNEIPTILMILIVILVIVKPFG